eukprot:TRINITY_DN367_c0_g1_i5.p1 TRINITY_DN367_c0_g1~~TRINITY_DN367_c0_g1_i5.p1  ORF type:complete len:162 (-),score=17.66 TRINITY_DN367_c0_g1_i5:367-852(-)
MEGSTEWDTSEENRGRTHAPVPITLAVMKHQNRDILDRFHMHWGAQILNHISTKPSTARDLGDLAAEAILNITRRRAEKAAREGEDDNGEPFCVECGEFEAKPGNLLAQCCICKVRTVHQHCCRPPLNTIPSGGLTFLCWVYHFVILPCILRVHHARKLHC